MGAFRDILSEGILGRFISSTSKRASNYYDGGAQRRRLKSWQPTQYTTNTILSSTGALLRARARDALRNNPHANAACESFVANLIGTGIKPSSLLTENAELRDTIMQLWLDWTDDADADGLADLYGMQTIVARALFEAGECFIRFRSRRIEDGYAVPLQLQLLESEMCPYWLNMQAPNGNWIMNGIELDLLGKRAAYWFYPVHPGDAPIEITGSLQPVRVPASDVLHVFKCTRPGQMRGVPLITPALVRMFLLDQYDDAELERKRISAMFAGFITTPTPEDVIPIDGTDTSAPQDNIGLSGLEPGTMQTLLPGEDIKFSEPADVGGSYEAYQYRQQLALFAALGIPYSVGTSDLRRANYSSLRGSIVEFRRKLEQFQHNIIVFQMCMPIWKRWMNTAVLAQAIPLDASAYLAQQSSYQRAKWIPQRNDWVDPLKDRQAEKLAVDAGFKSRSDVVEAEGNDPEENDRRIAADKAREESFDLTFPVVYAAATQPGDQAAADQAAQDAADAADQAAQEQADEAAASDAA
ncbi:lambda family phage portal protein [Bradyrhizobium sp. S3.9.2]|uniref:phage portal protein n=1 Tax=unclassified Bradyrhizobium TaxID=2631580 RepID=UPI00339B0172